MAEPERKRHDPRRDATRIALIEAAESLFALEGVEAVSTRRIGAAIGSLNTNVVAYHFGGKEALIDAVYRHRLPGIDRRRGELLEEADARGEGRSIAALMRAFALPLYEQHDEAGNHSYARFLAAVERAGLIARRALVSPEFPESERVIGRLAAAMPIGPARHLGTRLRLVTGMLVAALQMIDSDAPQDPAAALAAFEQAVAMAAAALIAPVPDQQDA